MIYNFDGSQQYATNGQPDFRSDAEQLNSPLQSYDPNNPDLAYAEKQAQEMINLAGAWITVYKRLRNELKKDEVWEEDADPSYGTPIKIKGVFSPSPAEIKLTRWGVDVPNQFDISFSRANVLELFGRNMIAEGDVLVVPTNTLAITQNTDLRDGADNRLDMFRVVKSVDAGSFKYRYLYWLCTVMALTGDRTVDVIFRGNNG